MESKNLYQKIIEIMKNIGYLAKDDKVEFGNTKYKAISEEKVTSIVRQQLIEQGIVIIPIEQEANTTELIRTDKSVNSRTDVHTKYKMINIDNPTEYEIIESNGSGVDTQDKGIGKAMTYAYKYMLLRTFAIPTGEDPDKISSAETDDKMKKEIDGSKLIDKKMIEGLNMAIEKANIQDEVVELVLSKYGYSSTGEILIKDYMNIVNDLKAKK